MQDSEIRPGERVKDVHFTEDTLAVDLIDGRTIVVPLVWYPRLLDATPEQRRNWTLAGAGYGIHWPDIDEDLSTAGLLRGAPAAPEPVRARGQRVRTKLPRWLLSIRRPRSGHRRELLWQPVKAGRLTVPRMGAPSARRREGGDACDDPGNQSDGRKHRHV